jgi:hypothetical protein
MSACASYEAAGGCVPGSRVYDCDMQRSGSAPPDPPDPAFETFCALLREFQALRAAHEAIQTAPFDFSEHQAHRARLRVLSGRLLVFRQSRP